MATQYKPTQDRLKADRFEHPAGTICYLLQGWDHGLSSNDERKTGVKHMTMTLDPNGGPPGFTVPWKDLQQIK
jgi:hypothetical protein